MLTSRLPTEPGVYFWSEWNRNVKVYRKGASLWVRVYSHWRPVKISPRIAGTFSAAKGEVFTSTVEGEE